MNAGEEEPSGGYTASFVDDVADYLKCKICMMVLKEPLMIVDCGHKFCSSCFNAMKTHTRNLSVRCPVDRGIVNNKKVFPDKAIERIILDLNVKCDHQQSGCPWVGELRKLASHLEEDCIFEERKRNAVTLNQQKEKLEECEGSLANLKVERDEMKATVQTLQNMVSCLQYQFTECNRQLQETRTEFHAVKLQCKADRHKKQQQQQRQQKEMEISEEPPAQPPAAENSFSINNEIEISTAITDPVSTLTTAAEGGESSGLKSRLRKRKILETDSNDENASECSDTSVGSSYRSRLRKKPCIIDEDDEPLINLSTLFYGPHERSNSFQDEDSIAVDGDLMCTVNPLIGQEDIRVSSGRSASINDRLLVVEELMRYRKTVFKWTLLEYSAHKDMGDAVWSPVFYSSVSGHCCRLWIRWSPDESALDLSFQICGVNKDDLKQNPLQRDVRLEMFNMYGDNKYEVIPSSSFLNATGYTFKNFVKLPELDNFVNNDSLFIKCVLK